MANQAIGMIECQGLISLIEASDAALKSADVDMVGWEKIGGGLVTGFFTGDVAAVKAAIESGAEAASAVGEVIAVEVIPRPHDELSNLGDFLK